MNSNTSAANIYSVLKEHLVCVVYVWVCTCMHAHTCVCDTRVAVRGQLSETGPSFYHVGPGY